MNPIGVRDMPIVSILFVILFFRLRSRSDACKKITITKINKIAPLIAKYVYIGFFCVVGMPRVVKIVYYF